MRSLLSKCSTVLLFSLFILFLPLGPLLLTLATGKKKFVLNYFLTLKKTVIHLRELMTKGSVMRFFESHLADDNGPAAEIGGHCNRCGNCCLNRKCLFLEQHGENHYLCGIYGSPLRKLTNCGEYPISQRDIDLYACPTYYVIGRIPVAAVARSLASATTTSR